MVRYYSGEESQRQRIEALLADVPDSAAGGALRAWVLAVSDPSGAGASLAPALPRLIAAAKGEAGSLTALAVVAWLLDRTPLAARTFDEAFGRWQAHGPLPAGLACAAGWAYLEQGRWADARSVAAEIAEVASGAGLDHAEACARTLDATVLALLGEPAEARGSAERALALVDPLESRSVAVLARRALGLAAVAEGDYDSAYAQFRAAFTEDGDLVHYHVSPTVLAELAAAAVRRGHREPAARLLERSARHLGPGMSARLFLLVERGRALLAEPERAERHFRAALAGKRASSGPSSGRRPGWTTESGCAGGVVWRRPDRCSPEPSTRSGDSAPDRGSTARRQNCGPPASRRTPPHPAPSPNSAPSSNRSSGSRPTA